MHGCRSPPIHDVATETRCKNCDARLIAGLAFCPYCGQATAVRRLTLHQIADEFMDALVHVDRSVFALVRALVMKPGEVARDYVAGRRKRHFGPFAFLVIVVGLASAVIAFSGFAAFSSDTPNPVAEFLQRHVNVVILLQVPLLAAFCKLFFRGERLYLAEHLVLAAYTSAMRSLALTLLMVPYWYWAHPSNRAALGVYALFLCVWLAYFGYAASQFYGGNRATAWLKGIAAAVLAHAALQGAVSITTYAVSHASP